MEIDSIAHSDAVATVLLRLGRAVIINVPGASMISARRTNLQNPARIMRFALERRLHSVYLPAIADGQLHVMSDPQTMRWKP